MQSTVTDPPQQDHSKPDAPPFLRVTLRPWNLCIGLVAVSRRTGTLYRSAERTARRG